MSTSTTLNTDRLLTGIQRDIEACRTLITLLDKEHKALIARNTDQLEQIINEKSLLLNQLNQSAITRTQWVKHYQKNTESSQEDISRTFTDLALKSGLKKQWETLQSLFQQCKSANEVNGKTMARSQSTNERLLNILRGQHSAPHLYDGKGAKGNRAQGNTLGQA